MRRETFGRMSHLKKTSSGLMLIGSGVPSLKPFRKNLLEIGHTLLAIATENGEDGGKVYQAKLTARG